MKKMLLIVSLILFMAAGAAAQSQTFSLSVILTAATNAQPSVSISTDAATRVSLSVVCPAGTPESYEVTAPAPAGVLIVSCTAEPGVSISSATSGFAVSVRVVPPPGL